MWSVLSPHFFHSIQAYIRITFPAFTILTCKFPKIHVFTPPGISVSLGSYSTDSTSNSCSYIPFSLSSISLLSWTLYLLKKKYLTSIKKKPMQTITPAISWISLFFFCSPCSLPRYQTSTRILSTLCQILQNEIAFVHTNLWSENN